MKYIFLPLLILLNTSTFSQTHKTETVKITNEILTNGKAYSDLEDLLKGGPRLTGSKGAENAVNWAVSKMKSYGFDHVWTQPVMVPKWERGNKSEAIVLVDGKKTALHAVALGKSVGTTEKGLTAEIIEVKSLKEVDSLGEKVKGKIVFYSRPFDEKLVNTFSAYGGAVDQRSGGASKAAKYGAIAVLVRSMTNRTDLHPHTGLMTYADGVPKIPGIAISTKDADLLSGLLKSGKSPKVKLNFNCKLFPDVQSYNVIGELTGSVHPDEIITVGGHLDSWDLSNGAHDDGSGCVQSIEVLRAFKALGIKPKRTVRAVLFMSEEVGGIGGDEYAKQAKLKKENHYAAIESDRGGFTPRGITVQATDSVFKKVDSWKPYFSDIFADYIAKGGSGTDIAPLASTGTALFGYFPDPQRYFDYHHSDNDNIEAINPRELHLGAASMAILVYLISEEGF